MFSLTSIHDFGRLQLLQAWANYSAVEHQAFFNVVMKYATSIKYTSLRIKASRAEYKPEKLDAILHCGLRVFTGHFLGRSTDLVINYSTIAGIVAYHNDGEWCTRFNLVSWDYAEPKDGITLDEKHPEGIMVKELSFEIKGPAVLASKEQERMPFDLKSGQLLLDNTDFVTRVFGLSQVGGYKPD